METWSFMNSLNTSLEDQDEFITTIGSPTYFCVGMIDIVNSTKTVSRLPPNSSSQFYEIFINFMAKIVHQFNGQVLKTMGDSLFFYFPDTRFSDRKFGFLSCLECGFSIISKNDVLKELLIRENLPELHYRISFDYGNVTMMTSPKWGLDLVGPTINTCAKINGINLHPNAICHYNC